MGARPADFFATEPEPEVDPELVQKPPWQDGGCVWWEKFAGEDAVYLLLVNGEPVQFCGAGRAPKWALNQFGRRQVRDGSVFQVACVREDGTQLGVTPEVVL